MLLHIARLSSLAGMMLLLVACASPVGVTRVSTQAGYRTYTENALSPGRISEQSETVLRRAGLMNRFDEDPDLALTELDRRAGTVGEDDRLFALAELSYLHARRSGDRTYFMAAAVYAYALLFPGAGATTSMQVSDPRLRLAYDLYNLGLAQALSSPCAPAPGSSDPPPGARTPCVVATMDIDSGVRWMPFGGLTLEVDESGLTWGGYRLEAFVPTMTLQVRGLGNRYRHRGLGASFAAGLGAADTSAPVVGSERLPGSTRVPVTVVLRVENPRASLAGRWVRARLEVYAADQTTTVTIDGRAQPLESDSTAALASQLEVTPVWNVEFRAFFRGDLVQRLGSSDGLAMLRPYRPGKIPLVLVHGTASSPARWAELLNELQGDPQIMERYQIWLFFYGSGNPIAYSAGQLRLALSAVVQELDPRGTDQALQHMVVAGHSQGGLLAKLTVIDSGTRFWDALTSKPFDSIEVTPQTRDRLQTFVFVTPLPFVRRVIFLATPHRGAMTAEGFIGSLGNQLVRLPGRIVEPFEATVADIGDEQLIANFERPTTAVDTMRPSNRFLQVLASIPVPAETPAHSIIAVNTDGPIEEGNDGVVTYRSAHIEEAVSELVVRSGHSVQNNPEAIEEIRRILIEHAAAAPSGPP